MDELVIKRGQRLMHAGLDAVAHGNTELALEKFKASVKEHGTADNITYWAWMEHHLGFTAKAIELCKKAIALDPDFGNPYNDIGSYLVALGKSEEAIPWLEKAKQAPRYEPKQFPYINLGRIYLAKQMHLKALKEFEDALAIVPGDPAVAKLVDDLRGSIQ